MWAAKFISRINRRKTDESCPQDSQLRRCMNVFDLTALGVGSVIDAGLYVVIGQAAHDMAGPAIILSFLIASVAYLLVGLCYAEFASRVTKAGSGYIYTYVAMGEMWAFLTGWCMIIGYVMSTASLASACSEYINFLSQGEVYRLFKEEAGTWHVEGLDPFPDFMAFALVILISLVVSIGVKESTALMDAIALVNLIVVAFVIIAGTYYADASNWSSQQKFSPFGMSGVITASVTCFYCFIGFDVIANASEEALKPKRSVPWAILLTVGLSVCAYVSVSIVLTLMVPRSDLKDYAPLADAFATRGSLLGKYVVSLGALCSMLSSLLAACFSSPRLIYSIASDGLISSCFTKVHPKRRVPLHALALSATTAALLALFLDTQALVEMVVIFTLLPYTMVALSVLLTRYQPDGKGGSCSDSSTRRADSWLRKLYNISNAAKSTTPKGLSPLCPTQPNKHTIANVNLTVTIMVLSLLGFGGCLRIWLEADVHANTLLITTISIFGVSVIACIIMLICQPQNSAKFPFTVPYVPLLPVLSISINMFLFVMLSKPTFIGFSIWILIGKLPVLYYLGSIERSMFIFPPPP